MSVIDDLKVRARQIKDATLQGEVTAEQVGGLMEDTIDYIDSIDGGGGSGEKVQSDWNETDSTKDSFIWNKQTVTNALTGKQDKINDLDTIRQGALKGATAIQEVKTINGQTIVGSGNIDISGGTGTVDQQVIQGSTNAVAGGAVYTELGNKQATLIGSGTGQNIKTINGQNILGSGNIEIQGGTITIDSELNSTSENPVQNKVVKAAIDGKQAILISGQNIKTINNQSLVGSGNIDIQGGTTPVLTPGCLMDTVDNYWINDYIGQWCQQNVKGSAYLYDIGNASKLYYSASGQHIPRNVRLLWYDKNLFYIDKTSTEVQEEYIVPEGAVYVSFVLYYDESEIAYIEEGLSNISFSFLDNNKIYIDKDMKYPYGESGSYTINLDDYSNSYIEGGTERTDPDYGKFFTDGRGKSICIPYSLFKDYDYLEVTPPSSDKDGISRLHFLKKEPKVQGEVVEYSDFYSDNLWIGKGYQSPEFFKIPDDARYILVYAFWGSGDRRPEKLVLHTSKALKLDNMSDWDERVGTVWRNPNQYQIKILHWNIGNYSNGGAETSIDDTNYTEKLASFKAFIEKYKDHNIVINEWNSVFARLSSGTVAAGSALWNYGYDYQNYVRCNPWDELGCVPTNTQVCHKVGVLNSLAGMYLEDSGYYSYPKPYVIYRHYIGGGSLYIMHTHLPTRLTKTQSQTVFAEMVSIMSGYTNVVICGDFNIYQKEAMQTFIDAGYTVPNYTNSEYTYPSSNSIYDWFAYRGYFTNVEFKVCKDAVDQGYSEGDTSHMLSDHWPIALTLTYGGSSIVPGVKGAYRFNPSTNSPEWHNGSQWFSFDNAGGIAIGTTTGTTTAHGNIVITPRISTDQYALLSAWKPGGSMIAKPYVAEDGGKYWWCIHLCTDDASQTAVTSTEVTVYYTYIVIS